jgi:predicted nucleic acid-binding protein
MSRSLTSFTGTSLYLDTMVFYALVRNIDPEIVKVLFRRIERAQITAFTSVLTFDELAYRLLLALIRDRHEGHPLDHLRSNEVELIATYYPLVAAEVERLQTFPNLVVLDLTLTDLENMHDLILKHHLRPRDALHLATMNKCRCQNLASNDADFDRVSGIQRFTLS